MTDTVGPVEAWVRANGYDPLDFAAEHPHTAVLNWEDAVVEARKIDAQMAALTEALEAVERWFTPRSELVEPYEELLAIVREALRSVKEAQQ